MRRSGSRFAATRRCAQRCGLDAGRRPACSTGKFSRPQPPVALIAALRACASAAMDISDGLIKDFDRLCRASGVGGRIEVPRVPLSAAARAVVAAGGATLVDLITGGEDYEVLATVAAAARRRISSASPQRPELP